MKTNKITLMQYIFLIHGVQVGVGLLTLPRELAEKAGTDGWITIILSWLLTSAVSLIIIQVMKKRPDGTILDLVTYYFGKWVGKAATILFALYFAALGNLIFIREAIFIQAWILPRTELYIFILLLSLPTYLIVKNNITVLGRYSELVFFITIWILIAYLIPLNYANWLHLLPVVKEGWLPIVSSIRTTIFSFIGFEVAFFLYPFLHKKEKASLGIVIANTITMLSLLMITLVVYLFFSPDEITVFNEPAIVIIKIIEFTFVERLEIIIFSYYIFVISTTVLPLIFFAVYCTSQLVGKQDHSRHLLLFLILQFLIVLLIPPTVERNAILREGMNVVSFVFAFVFPICIWVYVSLHGVLKRGIKK
ncbi:spore gernimation protein [Sutcliffiella cohnii]|uniref:Spore gernimation protein n=1 Tax=Sutcliffiella cohnii TaxID=33932 RepID=A0A223KKY1_9BACI|nr:endospore germination permease [Sutcliffiella cohnii]AST90145.1 spore gernimation protein [Sutcliffiella cohnii]